MGSNEPNQREKKAAEERRARFLELIQGDPTTVPPTLPLSLRAAAMEVGVSRRTITAWRAQYSDFELAYVDAMEDGNDLLEDEAVRRAVHGVPEPVFQGGQLVGHKQRYSDSLMEFLMAGRRAQYGRGAQITVNNNNSNANVGVPTNDQVARALALLLAEAEAGKHAKQIEGIPVKGNGRAP